MTLTVTGSSCHHPLVRVLEVVTPAGLARVHLHGCDSPRAGLLLGHGAGGGVEAPDLVAVREIALKEGVSVGLVEQPYRVHNERFNRMLHDRIGGRPR